MAPEFLFDWLLRRIAFLNLDNESNFLIAMSSLLHSLTVEGINNELVIESLRPLFEYACEVWDNCGIGYSDKLEKLQLDAARIATGLPTERNY
jgi:hypothetical protein